MASCDNRCTSGQEGTCKCSCGGANHGTAAKAIDDALGGKLVEVKGHGLDLRIQKDDDGDLVAYSRSGTPLEYYKNDDEAIKEIGDLIRGGKVEVTSTDKNGQTKVICSKGGAAHNPTVSEAFDQIRATGAKVTRKDGEFRVNVPGGKEGSAYYTEDPKDAIETAKAMMFQHHGEKVTNPSVHSGQEVEAIRTTNHSLARDYARDYRAMGWKVRTETDGREKVVYVPAEAIIKDDSTKYVA